MKEWIQKNLFNQKTNFPIPRRITKEWFSVNHSKEYNEILQMTEFLNIVDPSLIQRIFHIYYNKFELFKCQICDSIVNFKSFSKGYSSYCGQKCVSKVRSKKFKEKYNVDSPLQIKEFLEKAENTNLKKYGKKNYTQTEEYKEKSIKTCLNKYGETSPLKNTEIKQKVSNTNLEKYGSTSPLHNEEIKTKIVKTFNKKYGLNLDTYANPFSIDQVKDKIKETNLKKYGVEFTSQRHLKNINDINKEFIEGNFLTEDRNLKLTEFQKYFNISYSWSYVLLKRLDIEFTHLKSNLEMDVFNFVKSYVNNIVENDRKTIKPLELDIYLPDQNLAIEVNGIYWHSEQVLEDKNFHLKKTDLCKKENIQLLHIFEDQWNDIFKQEILKSMILNKIGKSEKIYARKCDIKLINTNEKNEFLNKNHLQGQCQSNINIGIIYNNKLISLMCFGKSRFNKKFEWELLRFCTLKGFIVTGGASKLLKYFINNHGSSIITYADRTYSNGDLYEKIGFTLLKTNPPSYRYMKNSITYNRLHFQKHKLKDKLNLFNPELTEYQNMINNGYDRIWDCGNFVYGFL